MVFASFVSVLLGHGYALQVVDTPYVLAHESTIVMRGGKTVTPSDGVAIELLKDDVITQKKKSKRSGEITLWNGEVISLVDGNARLKFLDGEDQQGHAFWLENGTIFYSGKGKVAPVEVPVVDPNGGEIPPRVNATVTSRRKLLRTSQRSLGVRGTEFRFQVVQYAGEEEVRLKVVEGTVTLGLFGSMDEGPDYNPGANVRFREAKTIR